MLASMIFAAALAQATNAAPVPPSQPAPAQAAAPARTAPAAQPGDDQVTCREDAETGSMIATRTCRTNAQWRQMSDDAQADMRSAQQYNAAGGSVGH